MNRPQIRPLIRPLILAAALLAPAAGFAQPLPPASTAPAAATPPSVEGGASPGRPGMARMNMSPEMRQARQALMQSCQADFAKFCTDAPAGGGGRMQCLRTHAAELSDGCKTAMQSFRAARAGAPQG